MISIVIPTLNASDALARTLIALRRDRVQEIIVSDGESTDATIDAAQAAGARVIVGPKGRGGQLARGADAASGDWLLFLHADTILDATWAEDAATLIHEPMAAGVFTLAFDSRAIAAKTVASGANLRTRLFKSPYGDQGLLISRAHYDRIGGYRDMPLFEDVDIVDRILKNGGRRALRVLRTRATTSAARYESRGYAHQVLRNWSAILRYRMGVSAEDIARNYGA